MARVDLSLRCCFQGMAAWLRHNWATGRRLKASFFGHCWWTFNVKQTSFWAAIQASRITKLDISSSKLSHSRPPLWEVGGGGGEKEDSPRPVGIRDNDIFSPSVSLSQLRHATWCACAIVAWISIRSAEFLKSIAHSVFCRVSLGELPHWHTMSKQKQGGGHKVPHICVRMSFI